MVIVSMVTAFSGTKMSISDEFVGFVLLSSSLQISVSASTKQK